jgi:hypothetical protein
LSHKSVFAQIAAEGGKSRWIQLGAFFLHDDGEGRSSMLDAPPILHAFILKAIGIEKWLGRRVFGGSSRISRYVAEYE